MFGFFAEYRGGLIGSVLLHGAVLVLLSVSLISGTSFTPPPRQIKIQATVVDEGRIQQEIEALEAAERAVQDQAEEDLADARRQREEEERLTREATEQRQQQERDSQQRQLREDRERQETQQRLAREREQAQQQRLLEEERLATLRREQQEAEKKRREAEQQRQRAEAEAQVRRQAEIEAQLAAEMQQELDAEQRRFDSERNGLLQEYIALVRQKVERNWIRPPSARSGLRCKVHINQIPGGDIVSVRIAECNANEATRRSIEAAVVKASPLPEPKDPTLFDRNLIFDFNPDE